MCANYGAKQARVVLGSQNPGDEELGRTGENGSRLKTVGTDFASLLDRDAGMVYWLAWYITEDNQDAEDVLQRTFLKAHSDFAQFQQNESSVTWLMRIALTEMFAKLRIRDASKLLRLSLEAEADAAFVPQEVLDWGDEAEKRYTSDELRRIVHEAIRSLTPFSRVVFLLRDVAKLRTEEIADLLHLSVPSIKSHLLRSRLQLREHLNKYFKPTFKEATQTG